MNAHYDRHLASHVLVALARAKGRALPLDILAMDIGVRKTDVRRVLTKLHAEGMVDATRMRLTLPGLALAASLVGCKLPDLRGERAPRETVAA